MQPVDMTRSLGVLPEMYHERFRDLHRYLVKDPSLIKVASKGQLAIRDIVIPGSSVSELVRALYVTPRSSKGTTIGMSEFLEALSEVGVPNSLFSSSAARTQYSGIRMANRDDQVSSSGYSSQKKKARNQSGNGKVQVHFLPAKSQTGTGQTISSVKSKKQGYQRFENHSGASSSGASNSGGLSPSSSWITRRTALSKRLRRRTLCPVDTRL